MFCEFFNVLSNIRWQKERGRHNLCSKEGLRTFFDASESIIFCEHYGADNIAKGEAGYGAKCDELRGFVFEPLRAYLDRERVKAGLRKDDINICLGFRANGGMASRKYFSQSQYQLPTLEHYEKLQQAFPGYFTRPYEELRQQYEELRQQYEELRRPFSVTAEVPYTDVWTFPTVQAYKGKHPCEKPTAMLEHIITASSRPGALVLDCFGGSGSTGIAAQKHGRNYLLFEIDPHWVAVSRQRLGESVEFITEESRSRWLADHTKTQQAAPDKLQLSLLELVS
jgi:site-specific DNA-methyltransferase (adenine-specific)